MQILRWLTIIHNLSVRKPGPRDCKNTGAGLDHNFGLRTFLIEGSFTTILDNHSWQLSDTPCKSLQNTSKKCQKQSGFDWVINYLLCLLYFQYVIFYGEIDSKVSTHSNIVIRGESSFEMLDLVASKAIGFHSTLGRNGCFRHSCFRTFYGAC